MKTMSFVVVSLTLISILQLSKKSNFIDPLFVSQISMFHIKTIKELQYKYNYTIQKLSNCCHFRLKMTILTLI